MARNRGWKIARLGLIIVAILVSVSVACQAATVTGMAVKKMDEKVEIHLNSSGPLYYRVISTIKPRHALVLEMSPVSVNDKAVKLIQIDKGIIERAKLERCKPDVTRLVVEVLSPVRYYIKAAPGNMGLVLIMSTQTIAAKESKAVEKMAAGEPTMEGPEPVEPPRTMTGTTDRPYKHMDLMAKKKRKKYVKPVKLVSIDFVNADLIYVLKLLAKELEVNLVTDSSVTGSVTMSLKNVSAQTAMNIIIQMNGFKQKKMGTIMFVGSEETMNALTPDVIAYQPTGDVEVKVIKLNNISAADAKSTIKTSYPLVQVDEGPQGTTIVVHANEKMINEIENVVKGIDVPKQEVAPGPTEKIEVVKVKYALASEVVSTLKTILGSDAPATMEVDKRLNAIVFKGYEAQIERAKTQLEELDEPLQQVMLSVKVVDLSETGSKNLGINWNVGTQDGTQPMKWYEVPNNYPNSPTFTGTGTSPYDPYTGGPPTYADTAIGFFIRDPWVLQSSLAMQVTQGDAKVIASPRVAAMDGKEANIHIGDKYPIVYYDPRAGQYQVIYVDIGIKLTVKPTITADGYITTSIETTVSDLRELINNQYPRTTERSAKLTIRVKDNNTIVIGGMLEENIRNSVNKVPLLGDIPVLGYLFRSTTTNKTKGEVVIMITPKIISQ